jgi:hypothetical protein
MRAPVDDYGPYLVGVSKEIHKALILRDLIGSPSVGVALLHPDSTHTNFRDFAKGWCKRL